MAFLALTIGLAVWLSFDFPEMFEWFPVSRTPETFEEINEQPIESSDRTESFEIFEKMALESSEEQSEPLASEKPGDSKATSIEDETAKYDTNTIQILTLFQKGREHTERTYKEIQMYKAYFLK